MKTPLRFSRAGRFKIVQFTDLHWKNEEDPDCWTRGGMNAVLEAESPDLVVFTGDIIDGKACKLPDRALRQVVEPVVRRKIPWAAVFGNHDDEGRLKRLGLLKLMQLSPLCLTQRGPAALDGVGNYNLRVQGKAGRAKFNLIFLDTLAYSKNGIGTYAWLSPKQIDWFRLQVKRASLPALLFIHIPLPEYDLVWRTQPCLGQKHENVCAPVINSGLFAAMLETRSVRGVFCGHDHVNDYEGELDGVRLCYGRATGHNTYGREGFKRGARVIELRENSSSFKTWIRLEDGKLERQPLHKPEAVTK